MRLSSILLGCALLVLSVHTTDSAFVYPDCNVCSTAHSPSLTSIARHSAAAVSPHFPHTLLARLRVG